MTSRDVFLKLSQPQTAKAIDEAKKASQSKVSILGELCLSLVAELEVDDGVGR